MRLFGIISLLLLFLSAGAQVNICTADPLPLKVLSIEEEKSLRASYDSVYKGAKSGKTRSYKMEGDTTMQTKTAFKGLQAQLLQMGKDQMIDSTGTYKQLYEERHGYHTDAFGNTSSTYSLNGRDTVVQLAALYASFKAQASRLQRVQSFSYGGSYLIIRVCDQYIGESSWGSSKTYYLIRNE